MKVYLAGKMTGEPDYGYPKFHTAAAALRAAGYQVVNPAELWGGEIDPSRTWAEYMRRGIQEMLTCEAVVALPCWHDSRGARVELRLAHELDMPCLLYLGLSFAREVVLIPFTPAVEGS